MLRDIESLNSHTTFLFDKINTGGATQSQGAKRPGADRMTNRLDPTISSR